METVKKIFNTLLEMGTSEKNLKSSISKLKKVERDFAISHFDKLMKEFSKLEAKGLLLNLKKQEIERKKLIKSAGINNPEAENLFPEIAIIGRTYHSMGCLVSIWVNNVIVYRLDTCQNYSKGYKYKPKHGRTDINLTSKEFNSIKLIGYTITHSIKKTNVPHIFSCKVIKSEGKYNVTVFNESMFLTSNFHGKTIESCLEWRKKETLRLLSVRQNLKNKKLLDVKMEEAKKYFVGIEHSVKVGNCEFGTLNFAKAHELNPEFGYNLGYLINLEPNNYYLQKILNSVVQQINI